MWTPKKWATHERPGKKLQLTNNHQTTEQHAREEQEKREHEVQEQIDNREPIRPQLEEIAMHELMELATALKYAAIGVIVIAVLTLVGYYRATKSRKNTKEDARLDYTLIFAFGAVGWCLFALLVLR